MVRELKKMKAVLKSNFIGWPCNCKIYIVMLMLIIFVNYNFEEAFVFAKQSGYRIVPYLFPFLFNSPFMRVVIFSCVIFLFSNAPFITSLQLSLLSRCSRKIWYLAQCLYIFLCSIILTIVLVVLPILTNANMIVWKADWGKVIKTLAGTYDVYNPFEYKVVSCYTPKETMIYTTIVFILLLFLLGMIIYVCNIIFHNQSVGIVITAGLIILDWMIHISDNLKLLWISPLSWVQISRIAYARQTMVPSYRFVMTALIVLDVSLVITAYLCSRKKDINLF